MHQVNFQMSDAKRPVGVFFVGTLVSAEYAEPEHDYSVLKIL